MTKEEIIQNDLIAKFKFLDGKVSIARPRRLFLEVPYENFKSVFECAHTNLGFSFLCAITGLDEREQFSFIYHLARQEGIVLSIKTSIPKDKAAIDTVTPYFADADIYEREIEDLLGVKVKGLPPGKRYPLPDDWPKDEHPLRKDWKPKEKKSKENVTNA